MSMPRGMGRYGYPSFAPFGRWNAGYMLDVLLLAGIIVILLHLFILAPLYILALGALLVFRGFVKRTPWVWGMW